MNSPRNSSKRGVSISLNRERGVVHFFLFAIIALVVVFGLVMFLSSFQQPSQIQGRVNSMQQKIDMLEKTVDDMDTRLKIVEMKQGL